MLGCMERLSRVTAVSHITVQGQNYLFAFDTKEKVKDSCT